MAAFRFYVHRMTTLPITTESRKEEWKTIVIMAAKNGYPRHTINNLKKKITRKKYKKKNKNKKMK